MEQKQQEKLEIIELEEFEVALCQACGDPSAI